MVSVSSISSNMNTQGSHSYVQVKNTGVFLTSFDVTYLLEGQSYILTSYEFGTGVTKRINIPDNATSITVKVEIAQFIGVWATVMVKIFPVAGKYCFQTSGTTLSPFCEQLDCQDVPSVGDTPQQSCCCCCCCKCQPQSPSANTYNDPCSMNSYNSGSDYYSMNSCCSDGSMMNSCCGDSSMMNSCCGDSSMINSCCGDDSIMNSCCGDGSMMNSCCGDSSMMNSCCDDGSIMNSCCGDGSMMNSCCGDVPITSYSSMNSCGC
ncbi:hypothetical protein FCV11_02695 [Clostridium botulinum]|uniref:Uncharacterized protein n=1 Tax=Clostridium botulinum TaxID=1491 RepID=A0A9Q4TQ11_CLOBO|nr:hypothetical protein [Clostridium botulinum]MCD3224412.1 hypothetical protein [Clostridium botulinum C]MCD3247723.1 hypothetical protein [Clostridium botulinum C]NFD87416.1 hypothetical protein [Clostridium botulinum]NFF70019.1 hypothetical protein [Clostridium botulinum]NFO23712.1 hypothetical protein [Clostridium botulinum]